LGLYNYSGGPYFSVLFLTDLFSLISLIAEFIWDFAGEAPKELLI
jgi:hypothetical protein